MSQAPEVSRREDAEHLSKSSVRLIVDYEAPNLGLRNRYGLPYLDDEAHLRTWRAEWSMRSKTPTNATEAAEYAAEIAERWLRTVLNEKPLLTMDGGKAAARRAELVALRQRLVRERIAG